jgi:alpha-amylase
MRCLLPAIAFSVLLNSCKLMKKEENNNKEKNQTSVSMMNRYTPVQWAKTTNIYEVNVRQYTPAGTLNAFAAELPRLKELGVETLWFMPLTPIAQLLRLCRLYIHQ